MPRTVIAAVEDMLFASKIRARAEHLDVTLRSVRNLDTLLQVARETGADLIIVDLHAERVDPIAVAKALKSDDQISSIRLLGFFSHVRTDLHKAAVAAGYDAVIPRSVFSRDLAEILAGKSGGADS
jgi:DNA-binding NarL/FixJ family response regulator